MVVLDDCPGDFKWNECGSPCNATCDDPVPVCIERCEPRCECPIGQVILNMDEWWAEPKCGQPFECNGGE